MFTPEFTNKALSSSPNSRRWTFYRLTSYCFGNVNKWGPRDKILFVELPENMISSCFTDLLPIPLGSELYQLNALCVMILVLLVCINFKIIKSCFIIYTNPYYYSTSIVIHTLSEICSQLL